MSSEQQQFLTYAAKESLPVLGFRRAIKEDAPRLKELCIAAFGQHSATLGSEHWQVMRGNMEKPGLFEGLAGDTYGVVCTDADTIVGMAFLVPSGNPTAVFEAGWCYMRMVSVDPSYGGRGIARTLTTMCIDHARQSGEQVVALHTSEFMDAARHIYETSGFARHKEIGPIYNKKYWVYTLAIA